MTIIKKLETMDEGFDLYCVKQLQALLDYPPGFSYLTAVLVDRVADIITERTYFMSALRYTENVLAWAGPVYAEGIPACYADRLLYLIRDFPWGVQELEDIMYQEYPDLMEELDETLAMGCPNKRQLSEVIRAIEGSV